MLNIDLYIKDTELKKFLSAGSLIERQILKEK